MALKIKNEKGEWVIDQKAIQTSIIDAEGNFESDHVEGALRELSDRIKQGEGMEELEIKINAVTDKVGSVSSQVNTLNTKVNALEEDVEWLKENGGGGGTGSVLPTITSEFTDVAIDKGESIEIPIFFSSPNMGDGTAYVTINDILAFKVNITQGNNVIKIESSYLEGKTENKVAIYVKDRASLVSNQLSWTVIAGGIELSTTFDYEVDYGITDTIRIPYTIVTGLSDPITLTMTVDGEEKSYSAVNGINFIDILGSTIGFGAHTVKLQAFVGKYKSNIITFNIVVVSTQNLYVSSSFVNNSEFVYGVPIIVPYRLSKKSTEDFMVYLSIDNVVRKTQTLPVGSYSWTIQKLSVGSHTITIRVVSLDGAEDISLNLTAIVKKGDYTPIEDFTVGLICDLNAMGKNNNDDDVTTWVDATGNGHNGKLVNFNFGTNGFINDELVCDNNAYVVIEWSPWKDNALTGSTIDLIYTPINTGVEEARVIDYTTITDDTSTAEVKPFKGLFADILRTIPASASSGTSAGKVNLDDQSGEIHLTWVLDRTNKFFKVYVDGVLCRIMFLSDSGSGVNKFYEDFSLSSYIYLNSTKGKTCGTNNIRRFRVYDHALTSDQVIQNHLASITDLEKQEEMYNFNYKNTTLPKMYLTGDTTNMTHEQTVPMGIEYISPNEDKYGQSFNTGIQNNPVRIQGTSSLQYVRHNYTIFLKDEYGADMFYNPYGEGSVAENVFCLKADYIESSHANNTGMAKFINDCVYDTKTPMQSENPNCRTTINGFPIEVYINGKYMGVYNFNHDRYSTKSLGYDYKKYPSMLVYEINSNSNVSAGAFYKYGENTTSSSGVTELEYYKRDFNLIYGGNRTTDSDTYAEIKTLVEWVSTAEQDLFRETISEHFNKEYLFRYFLVVLMIGAVDSLGKNMKIMTTDGLVWYPTFYDIDTCLGLDNSGYLNIEPDVEIESGSYNTSNSNLWTKVWNYFNAEIKEEWSKMRQGNFTLDNLMNYIYDEQIAKIPAKMYNDDAQVKYLDFGSLYTYCCHGDKKHQIKRWLRERIAYVDTMMGYFTSQDDYVTIRMNKTGSVYFDVTTYIPLYFTVKWSNASAGKQTFKIGRGEKVRFSYNSTTSTDQEIIIYHAQYIKRLDNLNNLNPSSCILSNAYRLTEITINSDYLYNINLTNNRYLKRLDLKNCTALGTVTATGSSLDLQNCKYLEYCNVSNTALTEVQLNTSGGSLQEIYYPSTIQSITMIKQPMLKVLGIPYSSIPTGLYNVTLQECPNIERLNTSASYSNYTSFVGMKYCANLTLRQSFDKEGFALTFTDFLNLKSLTIENMYNMESFELTNICKSNGTRTLNYIKIANCPKLETVELNNSSSTYYIGFADDAVLNLGQLPTLKTLRATATVRGLKDIVIPQSLEILDFNNSGASNVGDGHSSVVNIFPSSRCVVYDGISEPYVVYSGEESDFNGIDLTDMNNIKDINFLTLTNINRTKNFAIAPTNINPNFNTNRDNNIYLYFQPEGSINLTNYTGSFSRFFKGIDLTRLEIICNNNNMPQTDLSYCFFGSIFTDSEPISNFLTKFTAINNLSYCFSETEFSDANILNGLHYGGEVNLDYCFYNCPLTSIEGVTLPNTIVSMNSTFRNTNITQIKDFYLKCRGNVVNLFNSCKNLETVDNFTMEYVTDAYSMFSNCYSLKTFNRVTIPNTCTGLDSFLGSCTNLETITNLVVGSGVTSATSWLPNYIKTLTGITINNGSCKFKGLTNLTSASDINLNATDCSSMFEGCSSLVNVNNIIIGDECISVSRFFYNCEKLSTGCFTDANIPPYIRDISYLYYRCYAMTGSDFRFPTTVTDCTGAFLYVSNLTNVTNNWETTYDNNITTKNCYLQCAGLKTINNGDYVLGENEHPLEKIPEEWGGIGLTEDNSWEMEVDMSYTNGSGQLLLDLWIDVGAEKTVSSTQAYPAYILWGDGSVSVQNVYSATNKTYMNHTYKESGVYIVKGTKTTPYMSSSRISYGDSCVSPYYVCTKLNRLNKNATATPSSNPPLVYGQKITYANLEGIKIGYGSSCLAYYSPKLETLILKDVTLIGNNSNLITNCGALKTLDVTNLTANGDLTYPFNTAWNVENIIGLDVKKLAENTTTLKGFFAYYQREDDLDVSGMVHSGITDLSYMFSNFKANSIIGMDTWNTSSVTSVRYMFSSANIFSGLNVTGLVTSTITSLECMFSHFMYDLNSDQRKLCYDNFKVIGMDTWDTSCVESLNETFSYSKLFVYYPEVITQLVTWDVGSVRDLTSTFYYAYVYDLSFLEEWNIQSVTTMYRFLYYTKAYYYDFMNPERNVLNTSLNLSGWDVSNIRDNTSSPPLTDTFSSCFLTDINLSNWNLIGLTKIIDKMFSSTILNSLVLDNWDVSNVVYMGAVFQDAVFENDITINWNLPKCTDFTNTFKRTVFKKSVTLNWTTPSARSMLGIFSSTNYNTPQDWKTPLGTLDLSSWDFSKVEVAKSMFEDTNIKNIIFNPNNTWDSIKDIQYFVASGGSTNETGISITGLRLNFNFDFSIDVSTIYDYNSSAINTSAGMTKLDVPDYNMLNTAVRHFDNIVLMSNPNPTSSDSVGSITEAYWTSYTDASVELIFAENTFEHGVNNYYFSSTRKSGNYMFRKLTITSRQSFVDSLYDRTANGLENADLILGEINVACFTDKQIATMTNKGYIIT